MNYLSVYVCIYIHMYIYIYIHTLTLHANLVSVHGPTTQSHTAPRDSNISNMKIHLNFIAPICNVGRVFPSLHDPSMCRADSSPHLQLLPIAALGVKAQRSEPQGNCFVHLLLVIGFCVLDCKSDCLSLYIGRAYTNGLMKPVRRILCQYRQCK